ncbi:hypothetical protein GCM10008024_31750 [Allgaiera indica]|uniref:Mobilization protein n=1 Tax=Allgaiera indica TaxID=765699 RepID=A0AAN4UTP0_9RHOB|nr:hypothetical protein [Allgaiera indica]GHE04473.1 hypothetical protein GCM10008024_31750 [Allgaiera indica]
MTKKRKTSAEKRDSKLTLSMTGTEARALRARAEERKMNISRYIVARALGRSDATLRDTARRQDTAAALTDAARSLEEISTAIRAASPHERLEISTALLSVERALAVVAFPKRSQDEPADGLAS